MEGEGDGAEFKVLQAWLRALRMAEYAPECKANGIYSLMDLHEIFIKDDKEVLDKIFVDKKAQKKIKMDLLKLVDRMAKEKKKHQGNLLENTEPVQLGDFLSARKIADASTLPSDQSKLDKCLELLMKIMSMWEDVANLGYDISLFQDTNQNYARKSLERMKQESQDNPKFNGNQSCFATLVALLEQYERVLGRLADCRRNVLTHYWRRRTLSLYSHHLRNYIQIALKKTNCLPNYKTVQEESRSLVGKIQDGMLREMWESFIEQGFSDVSVISWEAFFLAYQRMLNTSIDIDTENILKILVTRSGINYVTLDQAINFISAFGPFEYSLQNAKVCWNSPWFYPFALPQDLEVFLPHAPRGTFLVRLSFYKNSYFAIDYVEAAAKVSTYLVESSYVGLNMRKHEKLHPIVGALSFPNMSSRGSLEVLSDEESEVAGSPETNTKEALSSKAKYELRKSRNDERKKKTNNRKSKGRSRKGSGKVSKKSTDITMTSSSFSKPKKEPIQNPYATLHRSGPDGKAKEFDQIIFVKSEESEKKKNKRNQTDRPRRKDERLSLVQTDQLFPSIFSILEKFKKNFMCPFASDCVSKPWFLGDLYEEEVTELLEQAPPGAFLLHYDLQTAEMGSHLLFSYKSNSQSKEICNVGLQPVPDGYLYVSQNGQSTEGSVPKVEVETFPKIENFLKSHSEIFKYNIDPENVPDLPIAPLENSGFVVDAMGPEKENKGCKVEQKKNFSCQSSCTYPSTSEGWKILCDQFRVKCIGNRTVFAVADGCSWGRRSRNAAINATKEVVDYMCSEETQSTLKSTIDCKNHLLRSIRRAHDKITEWGKKEGGDVWSAGQTTLLAGIILPLNTISNEWALVCLNVGDCKAFFYDSESCFDITYGNRANIFDARDSGGRLGPYVDGALPDLRNLTCYFYPCKPGDFIILTSDGVYDNLDPEHLGESPVDLKVPEFKCWDEMPIALATEVKSKYMCHILYQILSKTQNPAEITQNLIEHCFKTTGNSRAYMETHPSAAEPTGFAEFPGKMDHVTSVALKVGPMWDENEYKKQKRKKRNKQIPFQEEKQKVLQKIPRVVLKKTNQDDVEDPLSLVGPLYENILSTFSLSASAWATTFDYPTRETFQLTSTQNRITSIIVSATKTSIPIQLLLDACSIWSKHLLENQLKLEDTIEVTEAVLDGIGSIKSFSEDENDNWYGVSKGVHFISFVGCRLPTLGGQEEWFVVGIGCGDIKLYAWNCVQQTLTEISQDSSEKLSLSLTLLGFFFCCQRRDYPDCHVSWGLSLL
eukprot:TRINITY_DN13648_c0_g1_i1.p1 TRINITY_DN13648_c0_g1~~TRINITY_DN13648_c0_g1_i1.p1  ORF type:complete len:1287 (-),score=281.31 TRINITY_DN13648_c0_g1_i1:508-4347(-)